jgi:hypothetical protein
MGGDHLRAVADLDLFAKEANNPHAGTNVLLRDLDLVTAIAHLGLSCDLASFLGGKELAASWLDLNILHRHANARG